MAISTSAALEITDTTKLTVPVDYENLRDNSKSLQITQTITLKNTGTATENYTFTSESVNPNYGLSFNQGSLSLNANGQSDLGFTLTVPANADQGLSGTIAKIKATNSAGEIKYFELKTEVQSMLDLKKILVYVNDAERATVNEDGDRIRDLEPGDKVQLRFDLKNLFDDNYDYGTIDGTVKIELDDSDFGEDIDEETDFTLEGREETQVDRAAAGSSDNIAYLDFTVPSNAASGEYTLTVTISGKDENRAEYKEDFDLELKVDRRSNDVRVESFTITPATVDCDRRVQLVAKVSNYGTNRQRYMALVFTNTDLGINSKLNFELQGGLSSSNSETKEQFIELNKNIAPGIYSLQATAYYDYTLYGDKKTAELIVKACPTKEVKTTETTADNAAITTTTASAATSTTTTPTASTLTPTTTSTLITAASTTSTTATAPVVEPSNIIKTVEKTYTIEDLLTAVLIAAIVITAALIVLFFIMLLK